MLTVTITIVTVSCPSNIHLSRLFPNLVTVTQDFWTSNQRQLKSFMSKSDFQELIVARDTETDCNIAVGLTGHVNNA